MYAGYKAFLNRVCFVYFVAWRISQLQFSKIVWYFSKIKPYKRLDVEKDKMPIQNNSELAFLTNSSRN